MTKEAELSDIPTYCAHVRRDPENPSEIEYQSVAEHEEGVAKLCAAFAADFGAEEDGEIAGLTHDDGKCTDGYQDRLLRGGRIVDHATAGAIRCLLLGRGYTAACVMGHHSGLPDLGNPKTD